MLHNNNVYRRWYVLQADGLVILKVSAYIVHLVVIHMMSFREYPNFSWFQIDSILGYIVFYRGFYNEWLTESTFEIANMEISGEFSFCGNTWSANIQSCSLMTCLILPKLPKLYSENFIMCNAHTTQSKPLISKEFVEHCQF